MGSQSPRLCAGFSGSTERAVRREAAFRPRQPDAAGNAGSAGRRPGPTGHSPLHSSPGAQSSLPAGPLHQSSPLPPISKHSLWRRDERGLKEGQGRVS